MNDTRELNLVAGLRGHISGGAALVEAERQLSAEICVATGATSAADVACATGIASAASTAGARPERHAALKQARRAGSQPRTARGYRRRLAMTGTIAAAIAAAVTVAVAGIQGESAHPTANASGRTSPSATHTAIAPRPVSSAAELVAYATQAAAAAPPFDPKPHQWIYTKTVYLFASSARPTGRRIRPAGLPRRAGSAAARRISFGAFWERADGRGVAYRQDGVLRGLFTGDPVEFQGDDR